MRRQLTLFLPPDQRAIVEPIRQRLDPRQHAIIAAHVTLCRDDELVPWQALGRRLARLGEFSLTMQFGEPQVLPDGCVLLRPTHGMEQYQHLRQAILGSSANAHGAHVTLLHPRNAAGVIHDLAEIVPVLTGLTATFRTITLIEQPGPGPWSVRQEYGLPSISPFKSNPLRGSA
ncbi:MAG TPA: hypothetical protein DDZ67_13725 [Xanthomonadaceae bacterium]|nr:hypothetical protein [Xanthomonadaceae bacterium]